MTWRPSPGVPSQSSSDRNLIEQQPQTAQKLVDMYTKVVMPQARLAVESSLASYQTGTTDFLSVLTNELAVIDYEMNYHEQLHDFHASLVRLEQITGVELIP